VATVERSIDGTYTSTVGAITTPIPICKPHALCVYGSMVLVVHEYGICARMEDGVYGRILAEDMRPGGNFIVADEDRGRFLLGTLNIIHVFDASSFALISTVEVPVRYFSGMDIDATGRVIALDPGLNIYVLDRDSLAAERVLPAKSVVLPDGDVHITLEDFKVGHNGELVFLFSHALIVATMN